MLLGTLDLLWSGTKLFGIRIAKMQFYFLVSVQKPVDRILNID